MPLSSGTPWSSLQRRRPTLMKAEVIDPYTGNVTQQARPFTYEEAEADKAARAAAALTLPPFPGSGGIPAASSPSAASRSGFAYSGGSPSFGFAPDDGKRFRSERDGLTTALKSEGAQRYQGLNNSGLFEPEQQTSWGQSWAEAHPKLPTRANGGPVAPGQPFIAGDPQADGQPNPEIIIPTPQGIEVVPLKNLDSAAKTASLPHDTSRRLPDARADSVHRVHAGGSVLQAPQAHGLTFPLVPDPPQAWDRPGGLLSQYGSGAMAGLHDVAATGDRLLSHLPFFGDAFAEQARINSQARDLWAAHGAKTDPRGHYEPSVAPHIQAAVSAAPDLFNVSKRAGLAGDAINAGYHGLLGYLDAGAGGAASNAATNIGGEKVEGWVPIRQGKGLAGNIAGAALDRLLEGAMDYLPKFAYGTGLPNSVTRSLVPGQEDQLQLAPNPYGSGTSTGALPAYGLPPFPAAVTAPPSPPAPGQITGDLDRLDDLVGEHIRAPKTRAAYLQHKDAGMSPADLQAGLSRAWKAENPPEPWRPRTGMAPLTAFAAPPPEVLQEQRRERSDARLEKTYRAAAEHDPRLAYAMAQDSAQNAAYVSRTTAINDARNAQANARVQDKNDRETAEREKLQREQEEKDRENERLWFKEAWEMQREQEAEAAKAAARTQTYPIKRPDGSVDPSYYGINGATLPYGKGQDELEMMEWPPGSGNHISTMGGVPKPELGTFTPTGYGPAQTLPTFPQPTVIPGKPSAFAPLAKAGAGGKAPDLLKPIETSYKRRLEALKSRRDNSTGDARTQVESKIADLEAEWDLLTEQDFDRNRNGIPDSRERATAAPITTAAAPAAGSPAVAQPKWRVMFKR